MEIVPRNASVRFIIGLLSLPLRADLSSVMEMCADSRYVCSLFAESSAYNGRWLDNLLANSE